MRISDWSSDLCSSDLSPRTPGRGGTRLYVRRTIAAPQPSAFPYAQVQGSSGDRPSSPLIYKHGVHFRTMPLQMLAVQSRADCANNVDRKSVVSGKSVAVRVDLGGRSIIKKKKN